MPKKPIKIVTCVNCFKKQPDEGRKQTCMKCGFSPLPSYSYDKDNIFHPLRSALPVPTLKQRERLTPKPKLPF